ncbi:MAG: thioesterase family protein [Pseudomonadota bacterium]
MHRTELRPLMADVDAMNVVYYGRYLRFFEAGRCELMRASGRPYAELEAAGMHLPVTEAGLRYRRPARYDDLIAVETSLAWLKRASLRFDYRIVLVDPAGPETELVTGFTEHGCITHQGKVVAMPAWAREALSRHLRSIS